MFDGELDYIKSLAPEMVFIEVKVDMDVLKKRFRARADEAAAQMGCTVADTWASEEMAEARADFGEAFSEEAFAKYNTQQYFGEGNIKVKPNNKD